MANRAPRPILLTTEEVSICKASVTLKTIRVNDRQMTQSVFKQLPRECLVSLPTLRLKGVVWGWVNYDLACIKHQHFVFQVGQELRRCEFWVEDFDAVYRECVDHICRRQYGAAPPHEIRNFLRSFNDVGSLRMCRDRWNETMDELRLVEQLFIAC